MKLLSTNGPPRPGVTLPIVLLVYIHRQELQVRPIESFPHPIPLWIACHGVRLGGTKCHHSLLQDRAIKIAALI